MFSDYTKQSKLVLFGSWILAIIVLFAGILSTCSGKAYKGTVEEIYLNRTFVSEGDEIMYKFKCENSASYHISITCSNSSKTYTCYVLTKNSQKQIDEVDYKIKFYTYVGAVEQNLYLNEGTYYIYVTAKSENSTDKKSSSSNKNNSSTQKQTITVSISR